tara:strand:- start:90 stop:386 length:297 start_codon:yes stop_codon:yes gene_type:complete
MSNFVSSVRFRVKQGHRDEFVHKLTTFELPAGAREHIVVETGDHCFCTFVLWEEEKDLVNARPAMIAFLDTGRHLLEELSPELGVTDPVSGPVVYKTS